MTAQMRMAFVKREEPEIVKLTSLWDLCERWGRNLHLPEHQRDVVWSDTKRHAFIEDVRNGIKPEGLFLFYQARCDDDLRVYLNDGSQRLRAIYDYYREPARWGDTKEDMEAALRYCDVPTQHRIYDTHEDAIRVFVRVNYGTPCLPHDFARGIIVSMPDYRAAWEPIFGRLHSVMAAAVADGSSSYRVTNETDRKKYLRDNYGLFYRFLSNDMQLIDYRAGTGKLTPEDVENPSGTIEGRLRECMLRTGATATKEAMDRFARFISDETALIKHLWAQYVGDVNKAALQGVTPLMFRWLLALSIWVRNNKVDRVRHRAFISSLLSSTDGGSRLNDPNNPRNSPSFGLSKLSHLKRICEIVGSDMYMGAAKRESARSPNNKPGVHGHHPKPFVRYGNGATEPVAGPINLSIGTQENAHQP